MQHLDEGTIHAWLDGELAPAERAAVEAHMAECAECTAAVAEARGFIAGSSRILTALDTVPGGVLPASSAGSGSPRPAAHRRFLASRAWMAAAAVLVLSTVTVIAIRPRGDTAQLQVATVTQDQKEPAASAAPLEEKTQARQPSVVPADSLAGGAPMQSRAAAPADKPRSVDQNERLKSRLEAERQSTRVRSSNGAPPAMADAVPPPRIAEPSASMNRVSAQPATPPIDSGSAKDLAEKREAVTSVYDSLSARSPAASARDVTITGRVTSDAGAPLASASVALQGTGIGTITHNDGTYELLVPATRANGQTISLVARLIGYRAAAAPIAPTDGPITHDFVLTGNALALGQVVVTGEGTTAATEKLGASLASNDAPRLLSQRSSTEAADTVVTTTYTVRDDTITLIERFSGVDASRHQKATAGFSDQVLAKARADARINSITWSDSSGHTRTLRGAVPSRELERIRTALFGPTP